MSQQEGFFLTIKALENNVEIGMISEVLEDFILYTKADPIQWSPLKNGVILNKDENIYVKTLTNTYTINRNIYNQFSIRNGKVEVRGNLSSIGGLIKEYGYINLFKDCTSIVKASSLDLPYSTLANNCYESMFEGCTLLEEAPILNATTLATDCYTNIFKGCTSLKELYLIVPFSQIQYVPNFATMGIEKVYLSKEVILNSDTKSNSNTVIKNATGIRNTDAKSILNSFGVERCIANDFSGSYFSNSVINSHACGNTLGGGWNIIR